MNFRLLDVLVVAYCGGGGGESFDSFHSILKTCGVDPWVPGCQVGVDPWVPGCQVGRRGMDECQ